MKLLFEKRPDGDSESEDDDDYPASRLFPALSAGPSPGLQQRDDAREMTVIRRAEIREKLHAATAHRRERRCLSFFLMAYAW